MPTKLYIRFDNADINPTATVEKWLSFAKGRVDSGTVTATTAGGTDIPVTASSGGNLLTWFSEPLQPVTISGTVNPNLWGFESANTVNAGRGVLIERTDAAGNVLSTIVANTAHGTEFGTSAGVNSTWNITPTSTDIAYGERIKLTLKIRNVGTMAVGTASYNYNSATDGASGDTYIQFTETILPAAPGGTFRVASQAMMRAATR
jgi:hypothetical protein